MANAIHKLNPTVVQGWSNVVLKLNHTGVQWCVDVVWKDRRKDRKKERQTDIQTNKRTHKSPNCNVDLITGTARGRLSHHP